MNKNEFVLALKNLGIDITEEKLNKLDKYYDLLIEWNNKINLTRITDKEEVYLKHFYDSLTINKIIDLNKINSICDIGSGAGFPGIVLKIVFPHLHVTLIDSLNKRIIFLNDVIKELNLTNIEAICTRAEEFSRINEEKYDLVTARAVASLSILLECSIRLVKIGKFFVAMKGNQIEYFNNEKELKIKKVSEIDFELPFERSERKLLKFEKISSTPKKYPRAYSVIKKKPL